MLGRSPHHPAPENVPSDKSRPHRVPNRLDGLLRRLWKCLARRADLRFFSQPVGFPMKHQRPVDRGLGLKLAAQSHPMPVIVIERVDRAPTEN